MPDELPVHVSRQKLHAIEVPGTFETEGSFDVGLVNHGNSIHMHVHLDDALSEVAELSATNHHVAGESERVVRVIVDEDRLGPQPVRGKLKVVSAYGASTRWVDVVLEEPDEEENTVRVDESLAEPSPRPEPEATGGPVFASPAVPIVALAALALLVAA
ncbi:MAG: hypothetical protein V5A24_07790, partial [Haloarculaceae archaeon]